MMMRVFGAVGMVCAAGSIAHADVVFSDTEFVPSNWGFESATIGPGGTSTAAQVSGGNPGNARQMTNNINALGTIWGFSRYGTTTATRYEPLLSGAILSVEYSIDSRWLSGIGGQGQSIALGLRQGTIIYIAAHDITGSTGNWNTHSAINLTAADFQPLTSGAPVDFSSTAQPIRFGFLVGNSSTSGAYTNVVMYDNFRVVVQNVPAPASAGVLAVSGLVLARRRRVR
jgi:hypothetical protein